MTDTPESTPVCDYEGSDYRTRFWESGSREYEDRVERVALRRLMPPRGDTLILGSGKNKTVQMITIDFIQQIMALPHGCGPEQTHSSMGRRG